jgi:hypothetical protein
VGCSETLQELLPVGPHQRGSLVRCQVQTFNIGHGVGYFLHTDRYNQPAAGLFDRARVCARRIEIIWPALRACDRPARGRKNCDVPSYQFRPTRCASNARAGCRKPPTGLVGNARIGGGPMLDTKRREFIALLGAGEVADESIRVHYTWACAWGAPLLLIASAA